MTRNFQLTYRAKKDLRGIWRYTAGKWGEKQADSYLQQLNERFSKLAKTPKVGKHRSDIKDGYYCFPQGRHLIFYLIKDEHIVIIGIPHKSMDMEEFFD